MDWSSIITASVTGICAVVGQWLINRKKTREEEVKVALREQKQSDKLEEIDKQIKELKDTVKNQESFNLISQTKMSEIAKDLEDNNLRTLRLDLLHAIETDPSNQVVILDLAQKYFVEMKGNCYMSKVFQEWADDHNVSITSIFNK